MMIKARGENCKKTWDRLTGGYADEQPRGGGD